jgi:hypothetical protein
MAWTGLDVQLDTSPPSAPLACFAFTMLLAPVTNWEPYDVNLAGYCYAMWHGMKVQIVIPYRVSHLQRYVVSLRVVTSVYPPLSYKTSALPLPVFFRKVNLTNCAARRKIAVSLPGGVSGNLHWCNLSDRTMTLGSTQEYLLGVKATGVWGWQSYDPMWHLIIWEPQTLGTIRASLGINKDCFTFTLTITNVQRLSPLKIRELCNSQQHCGW